MARNTEFRNAGSKLGSTIRQSLELITGRNVSNYTLLFLDPTKHHKKGESKNIVVPYIVLGRNSSCHVQYGDEYPTVSRQHASIQSDDKGCTLIHNPQATNPTYVDGKLVNGYYNLETGDEIQLSQDGPRIRFIMDKTVKTSTMGFTRRMSMAIGQSLRPYKRALVIAGILLIGVIGYSVWSTLRVQALNNKQEQLEKQLKEADDRVEAYTDSLKNLGLKTKQNEAQIESTLDKLSEAQEQRAGFVRTISPGGASGGSINASQMLAALENNIYYIHVLEFRLGTDVNMFGEKINYQQWSGTGFLASDGRFYTARHVVQPWFYPQEACDDLTFINNIVANGVKVFIKYIAISSSGDSFTFTGDQVITDPSSDVPDTYNCEDEDLNINVPNNWGTDYAYVNMGNKSSNITYNRELSTKLERGERLYIHGFPGGLHLQDNYTLDPVYSEAVVAQNGIKKGVIHVTSMSFAGGNSGGPVFAYRNNKLIVIGIASSIYGERIGVVVPTINFR